MLREVLILALIASCHAQFGPPIGSLNQFASLSSSAWQDLSLFGGPALGISAELLQTLAGFAKQVFSMGINEVASYLGGGMHRAALPAGIGAAAGFGVGLAVGVAKGPGVALPPLPPPLPPLPKGHKLAPWAVKHEIFLNLLTDKWTGALVKAQFHPGLQGFLSLLNLQDEQEALVKWLCIIYPWEPFVPDVLQDVRDSYCRQALPAAALARLLGSGPPKPLGLPGPSLMGPGLGLPGPGMLG